MATVSSAEWASEDRAPQDDDAEQYGAIVSPGFASWLAAHRVSLVVATPPQKLWFVGVDPGGELSLFERTFDKCMGLAVDGTEVLWMAGRSHLWRFEHPLEPGVPYEDIYDRVFVPRTAYVTGTVNAHDVAVLDDHRAMFVNTRFGCLATVGERSSFDVAWVPPFLGELRVGDRCHLNGLATVDGQPAFATSVSTSSVVEGWRADRYGGGVITEVRTGERVASGLSMPHSPRWHGGRLYACNSGTGELVVVGEQDRSWTPVGYGPGFLRGLTFVGDDHAVIGSSKPRHGDIYSGLPLDERLAAHGDEPHLGLFVMRLSTGAIEEWLEFEGPLREVYDVAALPGVRCPTAIGLVAADIKERLWLDGAELEPGVLR